MKKIILTAMLIASVGGFTAVSVYANNQVENTTAKQAEAKSETPVKLEDLPAAITDVLKTDKFAGWKAESASLEKEGDKQYYKVVLSKEDQKTTVNFNEDGTIIEG